LSDISLKIDAGQLVVVVGENGSGKSTLVRLLSRLYDPTSGKIMIDGHPSIDYRTEDIHRATAILSQDNLIYPVSLEENIGLGYPEFSSDATMIREAAEEGGSLPFIEKLKNGLQTSLNPFIDTFQFNLYGNKTHPLYGELEKLKKAIDISGGEKQRIVA
jgi:ABC-type multidrug transport system fused ATPase/permease subunit